MSTVAVITRTRDRPVLLRRAVSSVLEQVYGDWVHVIVNDGGRCEAVDYLADFYKKEYSGRLRVIHNEVSRGMEAASNIGIRSSDSKYIVLHDDDDSWSPDFLRIMVAHLKNTGIQSVKGAVSQTNRVVERITGYNVTLESIEPYLPIKAGFVSLDSMLRANMFPPIAFLYEREYAGTLNFYDEFFPVLGDWDFNVRFMRNAEIMAIPRYLAYYHVRESGGQINTAISKRDLHERYAVLLKNHWIRAGISARETPEINLSGLYSHINVLQTALHNTALTIENIQLQMNTAYQKLERIEENLENLKKRKGKLHGLRDVIARRLRHGNP